ncbi:Uncharacterised protein [Yersinia intermedia]|nr:Uncharacterised protein [Yersinia intermedia]
MVLDVYTLIFTQCKRLKAIGRLTIVLIIPLTLIMFIPELMLWGER